MGLLQLRRNEAEPVIVQGRVVGPPRWPRIGCGRQGPIEVTFHQPQKTDKLLLLNENTGETIFVAAQKGEKAVDGIHASDFPSLTPGQAEHIIDKATVAGAQLQNVRNSSRENWPIGPEADPEFSLKRVALGGFRTNLGSRYQRRLNAWHRLQKMKQDSEKRRRQSVDDGIKW